MRVVLGKIGLDGHDRGIKVIARALRDAGHEVVYLGRRQTSAEIARVALEEDADVVGVSVLSGTHAAVAADVLAHLREVGVTASVVIGGTILRREIRGLLDLGIAAVFPVGTKLEEIDAWFAARSVQVREGRDTA